MMESIRSIARCEQGATAVEYGLIISLLVIAMLVALGSLAGTTTNMWTTVSTKVASASD